MSPKCNTSLRQVKDPEQRRKSCVQTTAKLARVFRMKILALRRRTELSSQEKDEGLEVKLCLVVSLTEYSGSSAEGNDVLKAHEMRL